MIATVQSRPKIVGIELLRFVSAFAVLVWHYQHFGFTVETGVDIDRSAQPFYALLFPLYHYGSLGVQVFWCISGFIFFFNYYEKIAEKKVSLDNYALNRFSRLYPLHFATLLIVALLQFFYTRENGGSFIYPYNDLKHFILNVLFMSDWGFEDGYSFNAPIWSVSVEIIVYFVFFAFASHLKLWQSYIGAIVIYALALAIGNAHLAECIMFFFLGGALALARYYPEKLGAPKPWRNHLFWSVGAMLVLLCVALGAAKLAFDLKGDISVWLTGVMIVLAVFTFIAANNLFLKTARIWAFAGNLTYSSYLTHFPIQLLFMLLLPALGIGIDYKNPLLFIGFMFVTLIVSAVVFYAFERPAQNAIRSRWRRHRKQSA